MDFTVAESIKPLENFCREKLCDKSPFMSYDFFSSLEESMCTSKSSGWQPEHIVISENKKIIGVLPNFKKYNSNGEFVFDYAWENAHYQVGSDYFPKYVSAAPFTPVTRDNFLYVNKKINFEIFLKELLNFIKKKEVSSFHANFVSQEQSEALSSFFFQRFGIQYHWKNNNYESFDEFLSNFKSRKRKTIKRERNFLKENDITFICKSGKQINDGDIKLFFECYSNTIMKKWSYKYLNIDFFKRIMASNLKKNILIISAFKKDIFVGCSLHFVGKDSLYGRYYGCLFEVPYLHFELCYYQAIEFAIKNKLQKVEAGAQGEHKISRGYLPTLTYSNHWVNNSQLSSAIKKYVSNEKERILYTLKKLNQYSPFSD